MLIDHELIFADKQVLTAAAAGTKVIDLEQVNPTAGFAKQLELVLVVNADVTGTLQLKLQDSDKSSGTFTDVAAAPVLTAPKAGTVHVMPFPYGTRQFIRAYFDGTASKGTVSAFLTQGRQAWKAVKQAESITAAPVTQA